MSGKIIDLVILAILVVYGFLGYKRGFIKSTIKIISMFASFIIAVFLMDPVSIMLKDMGIYSMFGNAIKSVTNLNKIQEGVSKSVNIFPDSTIGNFLNNIATTGGKLVFDNMAQGVTGFILNILIFVGIFLLLKLLFVLITNILDKIMSLPFLKIINKTLICSCAVY